MNRLMLVFNSLLRRRMRSSVTVLGVAIGSAALFSMLSFEKGYQDGIRAELDHLGAHVLVAPKGCPYDAASMALHGASWPCYLKEEYLQRVRSTGGVATVAPLLMNAVYSTQSSTPTVYVGADSQILDLKRDWRIDGEFPQDSGSCLLGSSVAHSLNATVGSSVQLPGIGLDDATKPPMVHVSGIIRSTGQSDDTFVYLPLDRAQALFKRPHQLTHMLVRLKDPNMLERVVSDLRGCDAGMDMNVVPVAHVFRSIQNLVNTTRMLLACVAFAGLFAACAGVSNAIMMSVTERTREIGVMRAAGASRGDVFGLVLAETGITTTVGAVIGMLLAMASGPAVEAWIRSRLPFSPNGALIKPDPGLMGLCVLVSVLTGLVSGMAPAIRASRISPVQAMRDSEVM